MEEKIRLDSELVNRGLIRSRELAKDAVKAGKVTVNGNVVNKPSFDVKARDSILYHGGEEAFVSRGGYKLQKALQTFRIDLAGKDCLDLGASTGGFTDCMLKAGAVSVVAVEGGQNQLSSSLRVDPRVFSLEKTDVRRMPETVTSRRYDFISCDLSFISLRQVFSLIPPLLKETGSAVFLIKPQFEAGRSAVGKNGIVRNEKDHLRVIRDLILALRSLGMSVKGLTWSPIKGGDGNIEYLLWAAAYEPDTDPDTARIVREAHEELKQEKR